MAPKHVAFAPACQKQLGSRLRSPLPRRGTMPAQPFSRFFTIQPSPSREVDEVDLRVCLSGASYAAAERRMALKI